MARCFQTVTAYHGARPAEKARQIRHTMGEAVLTEDERDKRRDRLAKRLEIFQRILTISGILAGFFLWLAKQLNDKGGSL